MCIVSMEASKLWWYVNEKEGERMKIDCGLNDCADFTPISVGNYEFVIKEPMEVIPVVDKQTDIGGKSYQFVVWPEIVGGEHAGKKVRRQFSNGSKGSRYFLKSFLTKVGVEVSESGSFVSEELLGKRFKAAVGERFYNDTEGNKKTASDLDTESVVRL